MTIKLLRLVFFYCFLIGVWKLVSLSEIFPPYLFPDPTLVWQSLLANLGSGLIVDALKNSLTRLAIGYFLAFIVGSIIGMANAISKTLDDTIGSLIVGLQSLPSIAWLPFAILWFGLNESAIIFVVFMGTVCAIAISVQAGVVTLPPLLKRAGLTFGANRWQMCRYVIIPGILPSLVQGLKLGWSFAWRSLLAGELLFYTPGIGHLLNLGRDLNDVNLLAATMIVIVVVGLAVDRLVFGRVDSAVRRRWGLA
ncbi:MAG: sulfate ABC transporter permease [Fimbriimonadales bacterium]|nr:MAG: sulfate ABC transporter permease [Fimbriimonadales bacterium]